MDRKTLIKVVGIILILVTTILWWFFWYKYYQENLSPKAREISNLEEVLNGTHKIKNCEYISKALNDGAYEDGKINLLKFNAYKFYCQNNKFAIKNISIEEEFNETNGFTTWITFKFDESPFTSDIKKNKEIAKKILNKTTITPKVDFSNAIFKIILDENKRYNRRKDFGFTAYLPLKPLTEYTVKSNLNNEILWTKIWISSITEKFKTKEYKALGLFINELPRLYKDTKTPTFNVVNLETEIKNAEIKLCRIPNESMVKIDVFKENNVTEKIKNFYVNDIDKLETFKCYEKNIELDNWITNFEINDLIWSPARSGLYYMTFKDKKLREWYNGKAIKPLTFWVIDSHITLKTTPDNNDYILVTDFKWNPIEWMKVRAYLMDFEYNEREKDENGNYKRDEEWRYIYKNLWDINKEYLNKMAILWTTDKNWVVKANPIKLLNIKKEKYTSYNFLYTASSDKNLTYLKSSWDDSIQDWDLGVGWWNYLDQLWHIFTDRKIYKAWETVYVKWIVRDWKDLSIKENKKYSLKILDPSHNVFKETEVKLSEFGSFDYSFTLDESVKLGWYRIEIKDLDSPWYSNIRANFNVEVFKNPKFKTDVTLTTTGLIDKTLNWNKDDENYKKFNIKATVKSDYYSWGKVTNAKLTYNVYKQEYYDYSYWYSCFWGCYWEWRKETYTSWEGKLDENGIAILDIPVDARFNYRDYKYVVEVEVTDNSGERIAWSNSVIVNTPASEKNSYSSNAKLIAETEHRLYKSNEDVLIEIGVLGEKDWITSLSWRMWLIIAKKNYKLNSYKTVWNGKVYNLKSDEEIVDHKIITAKDIIKKGGKSYVKLNIKEGWDYVYYFGLHKNDFIESNINNLDNISLQKIKDYWEQEGWNWKYFNIWKIFEKTKTWDITIYNNKNTSIPYLDNLKLQVIEDKIVYKVWEKWKMLVRLPFSKGKLLITKERNWVLDSEIVNVSSNNYLYEFKVTEDLKPNIYIGFAWFSEEEWYDSLVRVGYGEIVVDQTSFKTDISIKTDKETYKPREEVTVLLNVKDRNKKWVASEVTLMVVDDSLISLLWNVDLNVLEKIYKKVSINVSNALTSLWMKYRYFFWRYWAEWGSWSEDFKWNDWNSFSRTVFKNTAYFNPSVITDKNGNAKVTFKLPDNLTNFRIMAVSNSKNNLFWNNEKIIEVRKKVLALEKVPFIFREWDQINIWTNVVNLSNEDQKFKVKVKLDWEEKNESIEVKAWERKFITFNVDSKGKDFVNYTFEVLGKNKEYSDAVTGKIEIAETPNLNYLDKKIEVINWEKKESTFNFPILENYNLEHTSSVLEVSLSKGGLDGIGDIAKSLMKYPYGCAEQTTSSTLPNAILLKLNSQYNFLNEKEVKTAKEYLEKWIKRIEQLQRPSGWFSFWLWDDNVNDRVTPYVTYGLLKMKEYWADVPEKLLNSAVNYLAKNIEKFPIYSQVDAIHALSISNATNYKKTSIINKLLKDKKLEESSKIKLAQALTNIDKDKYKKEIRATIDDTLGYLKYNKWKSYYYGYWDKTTLNAGLIQLMIANNYPSEEKIFESVLELYKKDFRSYYFSTQTKLMSFISFIDFGEFIKNTEDVTIMVWNKKIVLDKNNTVSKLNIPLKNFKGKDSIGLDVKLLWGKRVLISSKIKVKPLDPEKIEEINYEWKTIKKTIYDINKDEKGKYSSSKKENTEFIQWKDYLIEVQVTTEKEAKNFTIEDYLPAWFTVLNTNLKTVPDKYNNLIWDRYSWYGERAEYHTDKVMRYSKYKNSWITTMRYIVTADFTGKFLMPPATAYSMYSPEDVISTNYQHITIK